MDSSVDEWMVLLNSKKILEMGNVEFGCFL